MRSLSHLGNRAPGNVTEQQQATVSHGTTWEEVQTVCCIIISANWFVQALLHKWENLEYIGRSIDLRHGTHSRSRSAESAISCRVNGPIRPRRMLLRLENNHVDISVLSRESFSVMKHSSTAVLVLVSHYHFIILSLSREYRGVDLSSGNWCCSPTHLSSHRPNAMLLPT